MTLDMGSWKMQNSNTVNDMITPSRIWIRCWDDVALELWKIKEAGEEGDEKDGIWCKLKIKIDLIFNNGKKKNKQKISTTNKNNNEITLPFLHF